MGRIIDEHLNVVTNKVEELWDLTIEAYNKSIIAFTENSRKKALKITKEDEKINNLDEEINEDTIRVISLQAPVASDLRKLISSLKISNQLERVADYTVNIADHILISESHDETTETVVDSNIIEMLERVVLMLEKSKEAYINDDVQLAKDVIDMDEKLDRIYAKSLRKMAKIVQKETLDSKEETQANVNTILIIKYLERAGDHIANVCESIYYMVRGRNYDAHHRNSSDIFEDE